MVVENTNVKKRQNEILPAKKFWGLFFIVVSNMTIVSETFIRIKNVFWHSLCGFWVFSVGPKMLLKTQIFEEKKGILSSEEKNLAFFSRIIECDKLHETVYKGPKMF